VTKYELLLSIRRDRGALDGVLARIDESQMAMPVLDAGWSVKDVLAHITAWEQLCLKWLRTGKRDELTAGDEFGAQVDALNARLYVENRDRPFDEIRSAFAGSQDEMESVAASLSEDELSAKPSWAPHVELWRIISSNSDEHYREHIEQLEQWLKAGRK
jgi:hypothetical protein